MSLASATHEQSAAEPGGRPCEGAPLGTSHRRVPSRARILLGTVGIALAAAMVVVCALIGLWWWSHRPAPLRDARALAARGRAYLRSGRPDLAFQVVQDVRDEEPGAGEAVAVAAQALLRMGQYRIARLALERTVKLLPNHVEATVTLGELNCDLGNGERGLELLEAAARLRPSDYRIWFTVGKVRHDLGDHAGAGRAYERVLERNPSHREALLGLLDTLIPNGQSQVAEPWVAKALQMYPQDPVVLGLAARAAVDAHHLDQAITLDDAALA